MATIDSAMKDVLARMEVVPLATASRDGVPNVVKFVYVEGDDTLWLVDNYFNKTLQNLKDNLHAALYVWSAELNACFQIKGQVEVKTAGAEYERMRTRVHSVRPDLAAKSLVVMHIAEVYDCLPGPSAGPSFGEQAGRWLIPRDHSPCGTAFALSDPIPRL